MFLNGKCTRKLCGKWSGVLVPRRMKRCTSSCWRHPNISFCFLLCTLIEVSGVQWMEIVTCERGFPIRTLTKTDQWYLLGDSLITDVLMIDMNGLIFKFHSRRWWWSRVGFCTPSWPCSLRDRGTDARKRVEWEWCSRFTGWVQVWRRNVCGWCVWDC